MRILVCDDEKLARERLIRLLDEMPDCDVVGQATNGLEVMGQIPQVAPDVVLLDIEMPGMTGIEVAAHLSRLAQPPAVIFCTAYDVYAIEAFQTHAVGYLLKPVRQQALQQALMTAQSINRVQLKAVQQQLASMISPIEQGKKTERTHLSARTHKGIELVPVKEIRLFKAEQKYVIVKTPGQEVLVDETLKELETLFPHSFIRVHRNALVALAHVVGFKNVRAGHYQIQLSQLTEAVPVSRRYLSSVRKQLRAI